MAHCRRRRGSIDAHRRSVRTCHLHTCGNPPLTWRLQGEPGGYTAKDRSRIRTTTIPVVYPFGNWLFSPIEAHFFGRTGLGCPASWGWAASLRQSEGRPPDQVLVGLQEAPRWWPGRHDRCQRPGMAAKSTQHFISRLWRPLFAFGAFTGALGLVGAVLLTN